ncbi:MAG: UDP-N-acetylglucosamine 4,6-dehydratase (inverting) [Elusimicrobia bacterium]|nr:UDP-N-acetylglucosamine 4,6-dehydratase (inverting) [Elusimicrobiota bacterium]
MPFDVLSGKSVLVTGGTGSFGQKFVDLALRKSQVKRLVVFSRDEWKQSQMQEQFSDERLRFFLGDVRDGQRLHRAFKGVDLVVHAAALKQVHTLEYNPFEAVLTNVIGAQNVINAAIDQNVPKVVALSTDKAVNPINLYGATKLCAEKLFINGNAYAGVSPTRFAVVRYGNVLGSRGSVVPFFRDRKKTGVLPITDERMTRFWITLEESVELVLHTAKHMQGGEIFVPKIPSMKVTDLAMAIAPECRLETVGKRPGEKLHEVLLTEDEATRTSDVGKYYVVEPEFTWQKENGHPNGRGGQKVPANLRYSSDANNAWLTRKELAEILQKP